jgi:energy-coupling factor transporter ATP-binding protein EcfA2
MTMTNMAISKIGIEPPWDMMGIDAHLEAFAKVRVRHPKINKAFERISGAIGPHSGTGIILLLGPTGAGKSALSRLLKAHYFDKYASAIDADPSMVPFVYVEAEQPGGKRVPWHILYQAMGRELNEPILNRKLDTHYADGRQVIIPKSASDIYALSNSIKTALKLRRTKGLVVDEAIHIVDSKDKAMELNVLKSYCNSNATTLIIVGSYDLLEVLESNAQLLRRTEIIHLSRYKSGDKVDELGFKKTLDILQNCLPITTIPDLTAYSQMLQKHCVGCVGVLSDTLARLLGNVLRANGVFREEHLEDALESDAKVEKLEHAAKEGEDRVAGYLNRPKLQRDE